MFEVVKAMFFTITLGIFSTLTVFLLIIIALKARRLDEKHTPVFFFFIVCATVSSILFLSYYYFPDFFKQADVVYCGTVMFQNVLYHHFLCYAIRLEKPFSRLHYLVTTLVLGALVTTKLFFHGGWVSLHPDLLFFIILTYYTFYISLCFYEMHRFYLRLALANGTTSTINHYRVFLFILKTLFCFAIFGLFPYIGGQQPGLTVSILLMTVKLAALFINIPLLYDIIRHYTLQDINFSLFDAIQWTIPVTVSESSDKVDSGSGQGSVVANANAVAVVVATNPALPTKRIYRKYTHRHRTTGQLIEVDKAAFERYFRKNKPYLNPNLTLNDLVEPLKCNRTYLSKFVNRTYGMNFNRYINNCRLREIDRLLTIPANRHKNPSLLISQAGFGNFRNYHAAKKTVYEIQISN